MASDAAIIPSGIFYKCGPNGWGWTGYCEVSVDEKYYRAAEYTGGTWSRFIPDTHLQMLIQKGEWMRHYTELNVSEGL